MESKNVLPEDVPDQRIAGYGSAGDSETRSKIQFDSKTTGSVTCVNTTYEPGDERNEYITYAANKLIEAGMIDGYYNWLDFIATWQHEGDWQIYAFNPANSNGTTDSGICQLNSRYHGPMINDKERMSNPYEQIDYCVDVAIDAKKKGTMPWSAWNNGSKDKHKYKFQCN